MPIYQEVHQSNIHNNEKLETPKCLTIGKRLCTYYGVIKKYFQIISNDMENVK